MSTNAGERPCPYCGELIKANAIKCRYCGEFLDEQRAPAPVPMAQVDEPSAAIKMIVPVGRSGWAIASSWLALVALVPFPLFVFIGLIEMGRDKLTANLMWLAACINAMFGLLAVLTAIGAFLSKRPGLGRAIFGLVVGILAALGYFGFVWYMVSNYVRAS